MVTINKDNVCEFLTEAWEHRIPSVLAEGRRVVEDCILRVEQLGAAPRDLNAIRHGLHEAVTNAIRHGNRQDPSKHVRVSIQLQTDAVHLEIEDEGTGFPLREVADPTLDENKSKPGGRGLLMMRHFMNEVRYNDRGNCVRMVKQFENRS